MLTLTSAKELYRNAIKSITDMLTFAKLIDNKALLTTIYVNQSFFHAACAYSRDMIHVTGSSPQPRNLSPSAFPIPSQTSPSMVFPFEDFSDESDDLIIGNGSGAAAESTYSFLSLIARANYQFLRQAIKDQAQIYAGSGWVDAVLDQRETGLRDVDLSIVSESISTFIRLHDLREPGGSANALHKVAPPLNGDATQSDPHLDGTHGLWAKAPYDFLVDADLNFDPHAFFNDYMFTGQVTQIHHILQ